MAERFHEKRKTDKRILEIVVPDEGVTDAQFEVFREFLDEAKDAGVEVWYKAAVE